MAKHPLVDVSLTSNGTDLSDHLLSISYQLGIGGGPGAAMSELQDYNIPSTRSVSPITANFFQDFAASEVWATHKSLWENRSTFTLIVKPTSAVDGATNPAFSMSVYIQSMGVINGSRGDIHMAQIVYMPAGALTIDETP